MTEWRWNGKVRVSHGLHAFRGRWLWLGPAVVLCLLFTCAYGAESTSTAAAPAGAESAAVQAPPAATPQPATEQIAAAHAAETPPAPPVPSEAAPVSESAPPAATGAAPATLEAPTAAEQEAARLEAEHREKREQERRELLEEAEHFIETADETLLTTLPYPLNLLFGVKVFNITLWRILASVGLLMLGVSLFLLVTRRFRQIQTKFQTGQQSKGWLQALDVAVLGLRNPLKILLVGIFMRSVSSLIVTSYHPDIVWLSNMLGFLAVVIYLFDMVGIIDQVYGDRIFRTSDRLMDTVRPMVLKLVRFFILLMAGLHIYQSITGQTMFSLLAGLGIGGIALALASQETLQNLLGFAAIAFDKSFLVGDAVTIANFDGTVEHVGLRSTRLRGYDGNGIVIPNSTAINSNIVNRARRPYIRQELRIALSPLNSYDKVNAAMEAMLDAVGEHEGKVPGLPPVVRFVTYEPARFVIQVLFWYDSNQPFFFDECSRVNLAILKRLSELGVLFAER